MIPLEALQTIDSIDRKGSFSAAAEELNRVPSAITYTIKKLEQQIDIKLFDRTKQRATLTPTGQLILERGRGILLQVQQLEEQAKQAHSGWEKQLRIVIDTILPCEPFWPLIKELQEQQPWLDIQIMDEALSGSWEALMNDRADLVVGASGDEPPGGHWQRTCLGHIQARLCCSPHHPASQLTKPITYEQVNKFTHIVISDSARQLTRRNVGLMGIQQTLAVSNLQQKLSALIHGMGISHLPTHLANAMVQSKALIILDTEEQQTPQPFYMSWSKKNSGKANQWLREKIIASNPLGTVVE